MKKLNIAILEDDSRLLMDLVYMIEDLDLAKVIVKAQNSADFIDRVEKNNPDAILLDIDLSGDSMNGVDVCNKLNLPTLFISGKTKEYLNEIEDVKIYNEQTIDFLMKPIREEKLKKGFRKFEKSILSQNQLWISASDRESLGVKTKDAKKQSIKIENIAFIDTEVDDGKRIVLENGKEVHTPRMNFDDLLEELPSYFLKINKSTIINAKKVDRFLTIDEVGIPVSSSNKTFLINPENKKKLQKFRPELF